MGNNLCSSQQVSSLQRNTAQFLHSIKYYDTQQDPVSCTQTEVYSYKQIFIHKKQFYLQTKEQLQKLATFVLTCAKCPAGIQQIVEMSSNKNIKCNTNYTFCVFAEHFNFSLKKHIENLRFKGINLKNKQILYILRELVYASAFLVKKNLSVKSFDSTDIYMNSAYQIKIPIQNIISPHHSQMQFLPVILSNCSKQILCLAPQQFDPTFRNSQMHQFISKNFQIPRVFSLGMLIMQCYTMLDSSITYYNYAYKKLDINKLNNDIKLIKDKTIGALISRMLQIDPKKRIKFKQLEDIMKQMDQNMFEKYLTIY